MAGLALQTFATMSAAQVSWLFFDECFEVSSVGPAEDTINAVLEVESGLDCLQPMMREMLKPTLVTKRFVDGVCFGQGCVTRKDIAGNLDSTDPLFREMRMTINTDAKGNTSTIVSVPNGDLVHVGSITAVNGNTLSVTVQRASRNGRLMGEVEEQVFVRCCARCGGAGSNCTCAVSSYLMQELELRPSNSLELRSMDLLGFFSEWSVGTWRMLEFKNVASPMLELNVRYTTDARQVGIYCSYLEQEGDRVTNDLESRADPSAVPSNPYSGLVSTIDGRSSTSSHYGCELCESSFKSSYDLKRHVESVHDKKRQHQCRFCKRRFSQSGHRNEHERLFHSGVGHQCNLCGNSFGVRSKLQRHIRSVHENIRTHQCDLCGKMFKEKNHLKKHTASHGKVATGLF
mmetsp:Transcript_5260/g.15716  ORF Transcript_5260/g.15716 Transcript_5260/m.15716 type:complete len:402 (+) Transcript_5260:115-1320(+)